MDPVFVTAALPTILYCVAAVRVHRRQRSASTLCVLVSLVTIPVLVYLGSYLSRDFAPGAVGVLIFTLWVPIGGFAGLFIGTRWDRRLRPMDEVAKRNNEMAHAVRLLADSLSGRGFLVIGGSPEGLASSGGQVVFRRGGMRLRGTNDRYVLMFDVASEVEPERWYLFTIVKAVLERTPRADSREPTTEEVAAFVAERLAELDTFFAAERWADSRAELQERETAQSAFMIALFKR